MVGSRIGEKHTEDRVSRAKKKPITVLGGKISTMPK